jgi:hypothetical protein
MNRVISSNKGGHRQPPLGHSFGSQTDKPGGRNITRAILTDHLHPGNNG